MKENPILAYLQREVAEFDIDEFMLMLSREEMLTNEEEQPLIAQAQQGDSEAMNRLLNVNMRFVVVLAKKYQFNDVPLQGLIQAGAQGLEEAIKTYDSASEQKLIKVAAPMLCDVIMHFIREYRTKSSEKGIMRGSRRFDFSGLITGSYVFPMIDEYLQAGPFVLGHFLGAAWDVENLVEWDEEHLIDEVLSIVDGRTTFFAHRYYERFTKGAIREDAVRYGFDVDSVDFDDEEQFGALCDKVSSKRQDKCLEMNELKWLNAPYIVSLAKEYAQQGVALEELIVSGLHAFGEAVKRYDTEGEVSLKAFAEPSIREAMQGIVDRVGERI